jgi:O-antigen ligase
MNPALIRQLIIVAVTIPLALVVGLVMSAPDLLVSVAVLGLVTAAIVTPIVLLYHHPVLVFSWNASLMVFFLPGEIQLWMMMAAVSAGITIVGKPLLRGYKLQNVSSVTWTLVALALVVIITAKMTGGLGFRVFGGSTMGGRKYLRLLLAIIGYFAISWHRVPLEKAMTYAGMFFLSGLTAWVSHLIYLAGPAFYFLYTVFPATYAAGQAIADIYGTEMARLTGLTFGATAAFMYIVMRFGVRGILTLSRPWPLLAILVIVFFSSLGGFRSVFLTFGLVLTAQFFLEGLHRTKLMAVVLAGAIVGLPLLCAAVPYLPGSMQRSLSFLPAEISPTIRADADASLDWRWEMWRVVWGEVPKYLWVGKGYGLDPTELYLLFESARRGFTRGYETSLLAGDYHNGPLSVLVPMGIWGLLAFVAFLIAATRLLWRNHRYGPPVLQRINTFLLAYFLARLVVYAFFYGDFSSDFAAFAGLAGLSVCLNGGMARAPEPAPVNLPIASEPELAPGAVLASGRAGGWV